MIQQTKFTYSPLGKTLQKKKPNKKKTIKDQGQYNLNV